MGARNFNSWIPDLVHRGRDRIQQREIEREAPSKTESTPPRLRLIRSDKVAKTPGTPKHLRLLSSQNLPRPAAPSHARDRAKRVESVSGRGVAFRRSVRDEDKQRGRAGPNMTTLTSPSTGGGITTSINYDGYLPTALSWAGTVTGEVNWTYNDRFLIESETIGALPATTVNYQYDNDGLVTQAGDLAIARDPASGRVTTKTIGRIRETFEYNEFAELSRQTVDFMEVDGATIKETLYDVVYDDDGANGDRDALGRITKKTEWIVQGDTPNLDGTARALDSRTYDYGYNQSGRPWLESVAVDGSVVSSYGYDSNGNRTSVELNWSSLGYDTKFDASLTEADTEYDSADKLLTYGTKSYEWNNFGQLSSMTDSDPDNDPVTTDSETTFYEYDLYGNLLSVVLPDGRTIEYEVDGAGRRVGRRELDIDGNQISFKGWIYRDLLRPIAEVDEAGNVVARYVYSDGSGARQNGIGQIRTRLGANQNDSLSLSGSNVPETIELIDGVGAVTQTLRLSTNQVGSVQLVVDITTGAVLQRIEYDSFGRTLFDSNPGLQPFGFAGGLIEANSELVRFGARDYSIAEGRWTTLDSIHSPEFIVQGYAYANSSPISFVDPTGHQGERPPPRKSGELCSLFGAADALICVYHCPIQKKFVRKSRKKAANDNGCRNTPKEDIRPKCPQLTFVPFNL